MRRVERTSPRLVALVGDLSPRRSLAGYPDPSGRAAPDLGTVLDGALLALAGLHAEHVSLGEIAAHDLVLRRGDDGRVAVHLSTASATGVAPASARRRDLEQLLRVVRDHPLCPEVLAEQLTALVDDVRSGRSAAPTRRVSGCWPRGSGGVVLLPDPPPLPPLPAGWRPERPHRRRGDRGRDRGPAGATTGAPARRPARPGGARLRGRAGGRAALRAGDDARHADPARRPGATGPSGSAAPTASRPAHRRCWPARPPRPRPGRRAGSTTWACSSAPGRRP